MRGRGGPRGGPGRFGGQMQGNRGAPRGRRGGFMNQGSGNSDYFQNQQSQQNDNVVTAQPEPEKPTTPVAPVSTQSGNNVQVVTTGSLPQSQQQSTPQSSVPSSQPQQQQQQSGPSPAQQSMNNNNSSMPPSSRGSFRGGRGFSRGSFSRGRGSSFGQSGMMPRQQFDTRQPSNLTPALPPNSGPPKMSRYDQPMQPPKRGRYDSGPYMGSRNVQQNQAPSSMPPQHHQSSYNMPP